MKFDAAGLTIAYALTVAASAKTPISDEQALIYGIAAGIVGGVLAGLMSKKQTPGEYALRIIASGLGAPGLVWFCYLQHQDVLTVYPVFAASGFAGLFAWPALLAMKNTIEKLSPTELKDWARGIIANLLGVKLSPKDGDK